jgi:hypothetical protein
MGCNLGDGFTHSGKSSCIPVVVQFGCDLPNGQSTAVLVNFKQPADQPANNRATCIVGLCRLFGRKRIGKSSPDD